MTPGQFLLRYYYTPVGIIRNSIREGGPWAQHVTEINRQEMEAAATHLGPLPRYPGSASVTLHLMTGRKFWYQSAFCLHSFAVASHTNVKAVLYDDGSIDPECAARLAALGPGTTILRAAELIEKLERFLPLSRFPVLRERWKNYPNIRKLIDVHAGSHGWKLVLDSDLLFFRRPDVLLDWQSSPDSPLHAIDCKESYGYSRTLMAELAGAPIAPLVNVGLCGLRNEDLNWEQIEHWCAALIARERTNYFLEQALVAMLVAGKRSIVAPRNDYITMPTRTEVERPKAIMHHYVDTSKRWYFRSGWRHVQSNIARPHLSAT
jgi:hypothetical protein